MRGEVGGLKWFARFACTVHTSWSALTQMTNVVGRCPVFSSKHLCWLYKIERDVLQLYLCRNMIITNFPELVYAVFKKWPFCIRERRQFWAKLLSIGHQFWESLNMHTWRPSILSKFDELYCTTGEGRDKKSHRQSLNADINLRDKKPSRDPQITYPFSINRCP